MNSVNLIGRIVNDLELKQTQTGKSVVSFAIAVNRDKDTTYFIDVTAWNTVAQNICRYFKKGVQIGISGSLTTRMSEYNGQKRKYTEVMVNAFDFVGAKSENGASEGFVPPTPVKFEEIAEDDILPF
jgi:single-strand DNA-binding protein